MPVEYKGVRLDCGYLIDIFSVVSGISVVKKP
jgi:hypothetical protein